MPVRPGADAAADAKKTPLRLALGVGDRNGDLGNQGIHQMDIARWILGENKLSPKIFSDDSVMSTMARHRTR